MKKLYSSLFNIAFSLVLLAVGVGYLIRSRHSLLLVFAGAPEVKVELASDPLWDLHNVFPGQVFDSKTVTIENTDDDDAYNLYFKTEQTNTPNVLAQYIMFNIKDENGGSRWKGSLQDLFDEPDEDGVSLGETLSPDEKKEFTFEVSFSSTAGNDTQGLTTVFDSIVGWITAEKVEEEEEGGGEGGPAGGPMGAVSGIATGGMAGVGGTLPGAGDVAGVTIPECPEQYCGQILGASASPITWAYLLAGFGLFFLGFVLGRWLKWLKEKDQEET